MPSKSFENFELKLIEMKQESLEDFNAAEKIFKDTYGERLEEIFPRDILGAKKAIAGRFIVSHVDNPESNDIFNEAVSATISTLPLSGERKQSLTRNILQANELSESLQSYFNAKDDISRDPFFALVEDFAVDGDISHEEFLLLQQSYDKQGDFLKSLEDLPQSVRELFHSHIEMTLDHNSGNKQGEFEGEFSNELQVLKGRGINTEPVIAFVAKSYYKTPGKYRKYEHPKRRMRRTFKIALLKLLRAKLGNIDAKIMLERFEAGQDFEDFFMLLFKLLEVVNEDPKGQEIYNLLKFDDEIQDEVFTAEENKQKILAGESLVMSIASLFSRGDAKNEGEELEDGMLEKILDESTDMVGEELHFNREDANAGIYDDASDSQGDDDESEEEIDYDTMSPTTAYEMLKRDFHKTEEEKRKAFLAGEYEEIDIFNDTLVTIQIKLEKLGVILGLEN